MVDTNYINNVPGLTTNMLHISTEYNLTSILSNPYSETEFNNLILNSNLDNYIIIK